MSKDIQAGTPPRATVTRKGNSLEIIVSGAWSKEVHGLDSDKAISMAQDVSVSEVRVIARDLETWDTGLLAFCTSLQAETDARGAKISYDVPEALLKLIRLAFAVPARKGSGKDRKTKGFLETVGEAALDLPSSLGKILAFCGDVVLALLRLPSGRCTMRMSDLAEAMYECGAQSLPIVAVTSMLFGLILAFVGAVQLQQFGAQIYVAGLVGIGMLRVMGAVMVGIVMSGRIGAAYAALIGTMQVNEEVDAMETLGISPVEFLVLPRMLALVVMVPLLTVFADAMGVLGGFIVGITMLDLTPMQYLNSTVSMVKYSQGLIGLIYASAFGVVIAISGCYHGINCGRSAQAVGQATTTAVVHSIIGIIVSTSIITVILSILKV